jgi:glyoxylase-like metal-dependent hydrolase (beta-lactamase superfamily II)
MRLSDSVALVGSGDARLSSRYDCNVYALNAPEGTIVVDTGAGETVPSLLTRAKEAFGPVTHVLLTHAHADHSQGGPACRDHGITLIGSEETGRLLESGTENELGVDVARASGLYPAEYTFENFGLDTTFSATGETTVAGREFESIRVRGHARDHVVYLTAEGDRTLCFIGDVVDSEGRISLLNVPGSSLKEYRADIGLLAGREVDRLFPGHGLPMLEGGQEPIDNAVEALSGMASPPSRT